MKTKIAMLAVSSLLIFAAPVSAQDDLIDYVLDSCESDINNFCNQVTPGQGRLLHCMAAHEDKISGQCNYALYQAATVIEQMAAAMGYLIQSCAAGVEKLCSSVAMGEGRLLACLDENKAEVSAECNKAISDTVAE